MRKGNPGKYGYRSFGGNDLLNNITRLFMAVRLYNGTTMRL